MGTGASGSPTFGRAAAVDFGVGAERRRGDDGAGGTGRGSEGDRGLRVGGGVREEIGRDGDRALGAG